MRTVIFIASLILSYALLSGWPADWSVLLRSGGALIVLLLAIPLGDVAKKKENRPQLMSGRRFQLMDSLYIGVIAISIMMLLFCVFALGPELAQRGVTKLYEEIFQGTSATAKPDAPSERDAPQKLSNSAQPGGWIWSQSGDRELPMQSHIQLENSPQLFIEMPNERAAVEINKHPLYVHSYALDHFDGEKWAVHRPRKFRRRNSPGKRLKIYNNRVEHLPIYRYQISHSYHPHGHNVFNALQHPLSTDVFSFTQVASDTYLLPPLKANKSSYSYSVTSQPLLLDEIIGIEPHLKIGTTARVYLSRVHDAKLARKITDFAARVPKDLPLADRLKALRALIRKQCHYSLEMKNPKRMNALENFLFEERAGYCLFYATATAMICREHGIPSRIALGWTGGKHYLGTPYISFRDKNAHAWAEIFLDGYGWVVFDTSPVEVTRVQSSQEDEPVPKVDEFFAPYDDDELVGDAEEDIDFITWKIPLYIIGIGSVLTMIILLIRRRTSGSSEYLSHGYQPHMPAKPPRYIELFRELSSELGKPIRQGATLQQSVLILSQSNRCSMDFQLLLDYHYDVTYRGIAQDKSAEAALIKQLKAALVIAQQQNKASPSSRPQ